MFDSTFGKLVGLVLGLIFTVWVIAEGVSVGGSELGQKTAVQFSTIAADPMNGTADVPEMQSGSSSVNIIK
ncbi:hypothetical protein P9G84_13770 [Brevibacillus centrosporus]|uniref:hypothetical protein n=1 Tax=Brevibacillus centrosporus TaxID=54910 RepID=UPI001142EC44|nr:hypothetical protein [Brevibacillus centrosporus]MEC2130011.1 hypothetical protein [Brevibacillus centrosporus]GED32391.1 hypothetical protein BCE02nite_35320 [Brevibacillus centrosporus]